MEGGISAEHGDWGAALSLWNKALALTPEDGILHEMRAQALNEVEDAWGAVQAASQAAILLPGSADVLMTLARAQMNLGEVRKYCLPLPMLPPSTTNARNQLHILSQYILSYTV